MFNGSLSDSQFKNDYMFLGVIGFPLLILFGLIILLPIVFYLLAIEISRMAEGREISKSTAFWISFLLGPLIGLIVVLVSPEVKEEVATKICPECAEKVMLQAKLCKHCGFRWNE